MTNHPLLPPDLTELDAVLDALGRSARLSAPAGLEDRVHEASRVALGGQPEVLARISPQPSRRRGGLALAAMIAIVATGAAVWLALPRGAVLGASSQTLAAQVELTLDDWNAVDALFSDPMGERLDELYAESAMVSTENDESDWWDFDLTDSGAL